MGLGVERKGRAVNASTTGDLEEGFCSPGPSPRTFFTVSLAEVPYHSTENLSLRRELS